jgi:hypothetical protein
MRYRVESTPNPALIRSSIVLSAPFLVTEFCLKARIITLKVPTGVIPRILDALLASLSSTIINGFSTGFF